MEQQLHKGKFPLMLLKNITNKRDVKERIFCTTQATFVTELWSYIVQHLKKLTSSTIVVRIHLQFHPHFAHTNYLHQFSIAFFLLCNIILFNILIAMLTCPGWGCFGCNECILDPLQACMCQMQLSCFCLYFHKWWYNWLSTMQ